MKNRKKLLFLACFLMSITCLSDCFPFDKEQENESMQTSVTVESGDVKKTENAQTDNSDKKENDSSGSEETRQGEYALSEIEIPATTENTDVGEGSKQETSAANTPSSEKADDESKGDDISMMSSEMGTTESESPNGNNEPSTTVPSEETQGIIVDGNGDVLFPEIP